ncbi:MAG: DUF928 domain-containing protein [Pleurocapsa sp.]
MYPALGNTEEAKKRERALPQAPDTGTPEEDFSAGGTRDNHLRDNICSVNNQKIVYLLGNRNREFTSSAYPTFWFHIPHGIAPKTNIKFVLEELETGKEIYNQIVPTRGKSTIKGIALPQNEINTLALNTNYIWSLEVSCPQTKEDSLIALSGWLSRLPTNSLLQNQLSITPKQKRYQVYLEHELLYDALSELAQYRIAEPNNKQIETAWNLLLKELGWQDLIQQSNMAKPYVLDTKLLVNNRNN